MGSESERDPSNEEVDELECVDLAKSILTVQSPLLLPFTLLVEVSYGQGLNLWQHA